MINKSPSDRVKSSRQKKKSKLVKAFGGKCQCCGYCANDSSLEIHHLDRKDKSVQFKNFIQKNIKISALKEELEKCILLCCNCHREVHAGVRDLPETFHRFDFSLTEDVKVVKQSKPRYRPESKITVPASELKELLDSELSNIAVGRILNVSDSYVSRLRRKRSNQLS